MSIKLTVGWLSDLLLPHQDQHSSVSDHCRDNGRKQDVRMSNIEAAKALADAVRTSLGPRGMDKMVRLRACQVCRSEAEWQPLTVTSAGLPA